MNDAEYEALKADIKRHFAWWLSWLGLGYWEWEITWHRTVMPNSRNADSGSNVCTLMQVDVHPDRLWFVLEVDVPAIASALAGRLPDDEDTDLKRADRRERELERMVVHELAHVLVAELRPIVYATDERTADPLVERGWREWIFHEERVVAQLTLAFIWAANEGRKRPRRIAHQQAKRHARQQAKKAA